MWYSVEALFRCDEQGDKNILYDRIVFLIKSEEKERSVSNKAKRMALKFENSYKNHLGNKVIWRLVEVIQIQNLAKENIYDGIEVFSHLMWEKDVPNELRKITPKSNRKKLPKGEDIKSAKREVQGEERARPVKS